MPVVVRGLTPPGSPIDHVSTETISENQRQDDFSPVLADEPRSLTTIARLWRRLNQVED
jgi:hypothetical protein